MTTAIRPLRHGEIFTQARAWPLLAIWASRDTWGEHLWDTRLIREALHRTSYEQRPDIRETLYFAAAAFAREIDYFAHPVDVYNAALGRLRLFGGTPVVAGCVRHAPGMRDARHLVYAEADSINGVPLRSPFSRGQGVPL